MTYIHLSDSSGQTPGQERSELPVLSQHLDIANAVDLMGSEEATESGAASHLKEQAIVPIVFLRSRAAQTSDHPSASCG